MSAHTPRQQTQRQQKAYVLLASALLCVAAVITRTPARVRAAQVPPPINASAADSTCGTCHAAIVQSYRKTAMVNGSGVAAAALLQGSFTDPSSGVSYRVGIQHGTPTMSFQRSASDPRGAVSGERHIEFYIGSGHRGRTYLYEQEGLWFEIPINFYTRRAAWDLSPNYGGQTNMPPALPVDPNCLHCHTTGVSPSLPRARNAFAAAPFTQGGISCSACHGDGAAHVAAGGHAAIVNPSKLSPMRRDSACIQCHLEGDAVVYRTGKSLATFNAGDSLQDTAAYFVRASRAAGGARATSQYEALLQSACKQASGDRLTCTTCHDPHRSPEPATRVAFYRARCLSCHTAPAFTAATHHPQQPDCAACHMPSLQTSDISHEQVTDHNIQRTPLRAAPASPLRFGETLVPVADFGGSDRELGLAYAQMAQRGDRAASAKALQLLLPLQDAADEQVALNLAFLLQSTGSSTKARLQYERVLQLHPSEGTALANLAVMDASEGRLAEATERLRTAVKNDPSQSAAALNLALLLCRQGQDAEAITTVAHAEQFNPDTPSLRSFERSGCQSIRKHP